MLQILLTMAAGVTGYLMARNFVRNRLRFVDAIHRGWAPLVAGALAFTFAWPLALLPLVSAGAGRDVRHRDRVRDRHRGPESFAGRMTAARYQITP